MTKIFDFFISVMSEFWDLLGGLTFEMYGYSVSWPLVVVAIVITGMFISVVVKN